MKVKLKVCGMRDHENIMKVSALMPDFMGFIFYKNSSRYVGEEFVLPAGLSNIISKVGVFVNQATSEVLSLASRHKLDFLQLHGQETPQVCNDLKHHNFKIIKVISIANKSDLEVAKYYLGVVDFFLFDTKGKYHGGNGQAFDWSLLNDYDHDVPYFLSGGLNPENVGEALANPDPRLYALDINSGVEISPAIKDINKVQSIKNIINLKA